MVSGCFEDLFNIGIDNVTGTKVAGIEPAERINAANDIFSLANGYLFYGVYRAAARSGTIGRRSDVNIRTGSANTI